jgi:antitoxin (DNA-binding transcriptional repressor) of toxin-antitoxin stability system
MSVSTIKSDEARNSWAALLDRILSNQKEEVIIERYSRPHAVLVNHTAWDRLKKAHAAMLASRSAEMDSDPSMSIPWEQVKQGMKERGLIDG